MPQDDFDELLDDQFYPGTRIPTPPNRAELIGARPSKGGDKQSEKAILNDTLVAVSALPETLVFRNNTGQAWQGNRLKFYPGTQIPVPPGIVVLSDARPVSFGLPGSADIIGAICGKPLAIEVKDRDGRQSGIQRNFETAWRKAGGIYLLVRSKMDALIPLRDI